MENASRMPRYEFRVLCANRQQACDHSMSLMLNEFDNVKNVSTFGTYDHVGIIELKTPNDALAKKKELRQIAGDSIKSIEIAAVWA